ILGLLIGIVPNQQVQASTELEESYPIPPLTLSELTKEYQIKFPVDASTVLYQSGTYTYENGKGKIIQFTPDHKTRTIKVVIQGEKKTGTVKVTGYDNAGKRKLRSNPGNVFCRYSDGYDWQAATYNINDGRLIDKRYTG